MVLPLTSLCIYAMYEHGEETLKKCALETWPSHLRQRLTVENKVHLAMRKVEVAALKREIDLSAVGIDTPTPAEIKSELPPIILENRLSLRKLLPVDAEDCECSDIPAMPFLTPFIITYAQGFEYIIREIEIKKENPVEIYLDRIRAALSNIPHKGTGQVADLPTVTIPMGNDQPLIYLPWETVICKVMQEAGLIERAEFGPVLRLYRV